MIAADTNVLVRLLTDDEPRQTAQARQLFETETIFLAKTVLLEPSGCCGGCIASIRCRWRGH